MIAIVIAFMNTRSCPSETATAAQGPRPITHLISSRGHGRGRIPNRCKNKRILGGDSGGQVHFDDRQLADLLRDRFLTV